MITLKVLENYAVHGHDYRAGQVIEVDEKTARWLKADAPGVFVDYQPEDKAPEAPPVDKMIKRARRTK